MSVLCNSICDLAHLEFCDKYWTLHVENDSEGKGIVFLMLLLLTASVFGITNIPMR